MAQGFGTDPGGGTNSIARAKVNGPAIGLMIVGGIGIVLGLLGVVRGLTAPVVAPPPEVQQDAQAMQIFQMVQGISGTTGVILGVIQTVVSLLTIFGGMKMRNLESYGLAMTSSILSMIPCISGCCLLGLPIGIWSIVVLSKPEVKSAFH